MKAKGIMTKIAVVATLMIILALTLGVTAAAEEAVSIDGAEEFYDEYGSEVDFGRVFGTLRDAVADSLSSVLKSVLGVLAVVLLSSLLAAYGRSSSMRTALSYASVLALSGCAFSILTGVFTMAAQTIAEECRYMTAFLPVAASLYALGGGVASGVGGSSALLVFLSVASNLTSSFLMPLMEDGFVLSLAAALPYGVSLRSVTSLVKNALTTILAFVFSIFGLVMYLQTVISAAADSFVFRTVRFASGAFIPVIGSMLGDAARTVAASAGVIRGTVGGIGVVALLCIILPSVVYTLMYKLGFLGCAIVSRALGCENEAGLLYDLSSLLSVLLAVQLGIGIMLIIAVALFIRIGVNV